MPSLEIANDGKPAQTIENDATNGYLHAAFTLIGDGSRLITGGNDGTLIEYDSRDRASIAGEFHGGHTGEINAIAVSEKAGLLVTGSADQTIRLWNLKTRELIVSMFFAGNELVVWMPQGYYYSSDDGDKLIGWQVNQGRDKEGRFIRAGQLKKYLWSPEMVRRAIILRSAEAGGAGDAAGRRQRTAAAAASASRRNSASSWPRTRGRPRRLRRRRDHRRRRGGHRNRRLLDPVQQPQCRRFRIALGQRRRQDGGDPGAGRGRREPDPHHRRQRISAI